MQYTIWSRGRLLGETDLGFIARENRFRTGWFHPNEMGERLMPAATGVSPAMRAEYIMGHDETVHADLLEAIDLCDSLELELRGPNGKTIDTEHVFITDTHYLLSLADARDADPYDEEDVKLTPEEEAEIEEFVAAWKAEHSEADQAVAESQATETEMPRYQVQVRLIDDMSVP